MVATARAISLWLVSRSLRSLLKIGLACLITLPLSAQAWVYPVSEWADIVQKKTGDENLTNLVLSIMSRESGGWNDAKNPMSTASGLFQYLDSTFENECVRKYGIATTSLQKDDPMVQIDCTIELLKNGGLGHWEPYSGPYFIHISLRDTVL